MNCPICNVTLQLAERQGVEIDFCPKCRGVWLDRGELDKIIERSEVTPAPAQRVEPGYENSYSHKDHHTMTTTMTSMDGGASGHFWVIFLILIESFAGEIERRSVFRAWLNCRAY